MARVTGENGSGTGPRRETQRRIQSSTPATIMTVRLHFQVIIQGKALLADYLCLDSARSRECVVRAGLAASKASWRARCA